MPRLFEPVVAEPGKVCVADLRAEAVRSLVASTSIIDRDPFGAGKTGTQHIACLVEKVFLAGNQEADDLPLGDDDAEPSQQREEPRQSTKFEFVINLNSWVHAERLVHTLDTFTDEQREVQASPA